MAHIGRAPALAHQMLAAQMLAAPLVRLATLGRGAAMLDPALAVLGLKLQGAGQRIGLGQPQPDQIADGKAQPGLIAHQHLRLLVMAEAFIAQHRDRHQAIAAKAKDRGEQT